ncbi:MAG: hypothetical protein ACLTXW_13045 [Christensenellales bacterium]
MRELSTLLSLLTLRGRNGIRQAVKIFLFFLLSSAGWTNLDKLGQMWTNLDKVGQNCVDFGERMCYDINVPRKARGCSAKTLSSFFRATRRNRAALFVTKKEEKRNDACSPAKKRK